MDAREFHQALERLNINIRKKEVYSVLAFLDVNHDNRIQVGSGDSVGVQSRSDRLLLGAWCFCTALAALGA